MQEAVDYAKQLEQTVLDAKLQAQEIGGPKWLCDNVLNVAFKKGDEWQLDFIEAVFDVRREVKGLPTYINHEGKRRISVRSAHGPGKTFGLALLMHIWNFTTYGLIACTAPKQEQLKTRLWARYRGIKNGAVDWYKDSITVMTTKIEIYGDEDWGATGETASDPQNLAGFHDEPQLVLVDEASSKNLDEIFPVVEGALTTPGSVIVEIGNPVRAEGEFHMHHHKPEVKKKYFLMHIGPKDAIEKPQYVSLRIDPEWVETQIAKYGRKSPVVQTRCFGNFSNMSADQLMSLTWLVNARERVIEDDGSFGQLRITADIADGGENETVVIVSRRYMSFTRLLKMHRFSFPQETATVDAYKAIKRIWEARGGDPANGDDIVVDSIGVGTGTSQNLIIDGLPVIRYKGGAASDNTKIWRNVRVQTYLVCRDEFRDGNVDIAEDFVDNEVDWDDFTAQMCSIKTKPGTERVEDLLSKKEMQAQGIISPDIADAVAEVYATQVPYMKVGGPVVDVVGTTDMQEYDAGLSD